ncbi:uncharacterized protein LOC121513716 isoform X2 [Cheilinus undulatus]|uniref:uncharacterized protein LOC121513716 isoform X2 n=1 Tax=Cheilinus undulatus TaxID=241271 RepID=UPI001BD4DF4A|nr:uncharacterized protein LOC121513716 isoform X2 [Cheilinus undulatus]
MTAERVLFDTLKKLSSEELHDFNLHVEVEKGTPLLKTGQPKAVNTEVVVELMVKTYSAECVELTRKILKKMNRTDLMLRLSDSSLGAREKHSVFKQQPSFSQTVEMVMSDIKLLMGTLHGLNKGELVKFKMVLRDMCLQMHDIDIQWWLLLWNGYEETVFLIVLSCRHDSVGMTKEALEKIGRTDLVKRTTDSSSKFKKEHSDGEHSVLMKVATMAATQQLLLEILHCLSEEELKTFTEFLQMNISSQNLIGILYIGRYGDKRAKTVDLMMHIYGRRCVELTREVLMKMNRTDLVEMLSGTSSASKETPSSDDHQSTTDETANQSVKADEVPSLLRTLKLLSDKELEKFKLLLQFSYFRRSIQQIPWTILMQGRAAHDVVDLMMKKQQPLEVTNEVLMDLSRNDLIIRPSKSSRVKKKPHQSRMMWHQRDPKTSICANLAKALQYLSSEEHDRFKQLLLHDAMNKGLQIHPEQVRNAGRVGMAELMVDVFGQLSEEMTKDILQKMGRTDLLKRLPETISRLKTQKDPQSKYRLKESTMTPLHVKLLEILEELSSGELEKFKHVLQYTKMREGLPKMPRDQVETADKRQTAELMVEIYGQQCVEVTKDALEMINRTDLLEKLSESISGSEGPSRSLEPEDCERNTDPCNWTKLEPGVKSTDEDKSPTYSLQSEAGSCFECSVSGMRWTCKEKVSFQYQFCSWGEHVERIEGLKYLPAGPLMNIKITAGKFDEVYLPHWICFEDDPEILDKFAVLHIDDCGDVVEQVSEVTPTHVKLCDPVFSPKAVLIKAGVPVKTHCSVLIYKTNTAFLTLHVYLVPRDPGLQQEMDKRESSYGYKLIRKPHPEKSLKIRDRFILTADVEGAEIYPEEMKLRYEWRTPNFFEVFLENPDKNFTLKLAQKNESTPVWTCAVRKDEYQSTGHSKEEHFVDKYQCELIKRVSNTGPILDKLLKEGVIHPEDYGKMRATPTTQEKMRELFSGPLKAAGQAGKDVFYKLLEKEESYLVADLKRNKL